MEKIHELIKNFDMFKTSLNLTLQGKNKSKTFYGAILSIFIITSFFILMIYLFNDLFTKKNQFYTSNKLKFLDPPAFNLTSDILTSKKFSIPFFFFAIKIVDENSEDITYDEFNKYLYVNIQLITMFNQKSADSASIKYNLLPCQKLFNTSINYFNLHSSDKNSIVNDTSLLCVNSSLIEIQGDFVSKTFKYLSMKFKPCSYNPDKNIACNKDRKSFISFMKRLRINFIISSDYIKTSKIGDIPLEYFTRINSFKILDFMYQKVDYYLSYSFFETKENLVLDFLGKLSDYYITVPKININYASFTSNYLSLYLRSNYDYFYMIRSYKTFFNLISQLGGIWKFLLILGISLISKFNLKSMLNNMGNKLYAVISPLVTQSILLTETLVYYKNKSSDANPHEYLITNNKSDLEADLYIDVYKYERNRGFSVSMNEMIRHNYFTCCLNEDQKKLKSLEEKLENEILMKLDFIKILKFVKQFKILKLIIFGKKRSLIDLKKKQMINYNKIVYFSKKINKFLIKPGKDSENINKSEKRLKREKLFINGLRYYKSKPILDRKIDINIFNKFKWNYEKINFYLNKVHLKNIKK